MLIGTAVSDVTLRGAGARPVVEYGDYRADAPCAATAAMPELRRR